MYLYPQKSSQGFLTQLFCNVFLARHKTLWFNFFWPIWSCHTQWNVAYFDKLFDFSSHFLEKSSWLVNIFFIFTKTFEI